MNGLLRVTFVATSLCLFLGLSPDALAACSGPGGEDGEIIYNEDHKTFQGCADGQWVALHAAVLDACTGTNTPPTIGQICADGSIYGGSTVGGASLYVARCDAGMTWDGASCTGSQNKRQYGGYGTNINGNSVSNPPQNADDGYINTNWLLDNGEGDHEAAQICRDLGPGWYLPSINELNTISTNLADTGVTPGSTYDFNLSGSRTSSGWYWSSTENLNATDARFVRMDWGVESNYSKNTALAVRCVTRSGIGCSNGEIIYNEDHKTFQGCADGQWVALHATSSDPCAGSPALGTECADGSYYVGDSPEDGAKVFMTSSAHETTARWDSASCYHCGNGSVATSVTDGRANTNALLTFNASGFDAAAYCNDLTDVHGHSDWYLPASDNVSNSELNLFWTMVQSAGAVDGIGVGSTKYWSSTEYPDGTNVEHQQFDTGFQGSNTKSTTYNVRCVRR